MEFSTFVPMRIISKDALGKDRFFGKQDGDANIYMLAVLRQLLT